MKAAARNMVKAAFTTPRNHQAFAIYMGWP